MLKNRRAMPAWLMSFFLHAGVLGGLTMVQVARAPAETLLAIETFFEEDRPPEEFTKELDQQVEAAETINLVAGGVLAQQNSGSNAPAAQQTKIDPSQVIK